MLPPLNEFGVDFSGLTPEQFEFRPFPGDRYVRGQDDTVDVWCDSAGTLFHRRADRSIAALTAEDDEPVGGVISYSDGFACVCSDGTCQRI